MDPHHDNEESASALIISASDKAGMEGIDRQRIDEIILRTSGDSAYMKQQRKRDQAVNVKIQQMKQRLEQQEQGKDHKDNTWRQALERELDVEIQDLIQARRPHSTCVVVDMDMFYMACELLTKPHLTKVPACVGSGMILTSNYLARKFGVRSAMAGFVADKLVEELSNGTQKLHHIPSNFELYTTKSHQMRNVLAEYDPQLRAYSLDEAYLDLASYLALHLDHPEWTHEQIRDALMKVAATELDTKCLASGETTSMNMAEEESTMRDTCMEGNLSRFSSQTVMSAATKIVQEMRSKVQEATGGLTCSAGLASNFMLAKIASDCNKPNGQLVVGPSHEEVQAFVHPLPTRKIPGIGRVTDKMLHAFRITNVQQLYEQRALVRFLFTPATARFLLAASLGYSSNDSNSSEHLSERKGISKERTFQAGKPWSEVRSRLEDIARGLSADMLSKQLRAHTMTVKVKLDTFDVLSRSRTMPRGIYLQEPEQMVSLAAELVMELKRQHKGSAFSVRLLGVRCSNFQGEEEEAQDAHQMKIEQFLCKDRKRSASPIPASRGVSPMLSPLSKQEVFASARSPKISPYANRPSAPQTDNQAPQSSPTVHDSTLFQQQQLHCPICGQAIRDSNDNDAVNRHVDSCLNSSMVRQAIQEESLAANERSKKPRLTDFFQTR